MSVRVQRFDSDPASRISAAGAAQCATAHSHTTLLHSSPWHTQHSHHGLHTLIHTAGSTWQDPHDRIRRSFPALSHSAPTRLSHDFGGTRSMRGKSRHVTNGPHSHHVTPSREPSMARPPPRSTQHAPPTQMDHKVLVRHGTQGSSQVSACDSPYPLESLGRESHLTR